MLAAFRDGPPDEAARALLGLVLVRAGDPAQGGVMRAGRIVETEAYAGAEDRASHARFGRTPRNATMFAAAGRAYVYGVYGMHTCLNVVVGPAGAASAVLVRSVEPLTGIEAMRASRAARAVATRRVDAADPAAAFARVDRVAASRLASGPGNVAAAFDITRADDGLDLLDPTGRLRLEAAATGARFEIASGPRVGVGYAGPGWTERPWRFWIAGNPAVSATRTIR